MSDVSIRLDGLVLLMAFGAGAMVYGSIALAGGVVAWFRPASRRRAWRVSRAAGCMAVGTVLAGGLFFYTVDSPATSDVDWIDWLTVPWGLLFLAGCWGLTRVGRVK